MRVKQIIILLIVFCFLILNFLFADSNDSIVNHLDKIFKVKKYVYKGKKHVVDEISKLPEKNPFAKLVNDNIIYLNYIVNNFFKLDNYNDLLKTKDLKEMNKKYIETIKKDKDFINMLKEFEYYYLNKSDKNNKKVFSLDEVVEIATKFFAISGIVRNKYALHVCVGINLIKDTEKERHPHLEGFLINAIFKDMNNKDSILNDVYNSLDKLYKLNLGIDKDKRVLRAQGALLILLFENPGLKKLIVREYEKSKDFLPFVIKYDINK